MSSPILASPPGPRQQQEHREDPDDSSSRPGSIPGRKAGWGGNEARLGTRQKLLRGPAASGGSQPGKLAPQGDMEQH